LIYSAGGGTRRNDEKLKKTTTDNATLFCAANVFFCAANVFAPLIFAPFSPHISLSSSTFKEWQYVAAQMSSSAFALWIATKSSREQRLRLTRRAQCRLTTYFRQTTGLTRADADTPRQARTHPT
jgi:hypothetical protein